MNKLDTIETITLDQLSSVTGGWAAWNQSSPSHESWSASGSAGGAWTSGAAWNGASNGGQQWSWSK